MKMRKKLAALLAAAMIASVMPMTAFAASTNRVSNVVTGKTDVTIPTTGAPELKIKLIDQLSTGVAFYVNLTGAEWKPSLATNAVITDSTETGNAISFQRIDDDVLRIMGDNLVKDDTITVKLDTLLTGGEATVEVESAGTVVSSSTHVFANASNDAASKLIVADAKNFADKSGKAAKVTLKEPFKGAFTGLTAQEREFTIELRDSDFYFVTDADSKLVGTKGFHGLNGTIVNNTDELKITIPATGTVAQQGEFELVGVRIGAKKGATKGDVLTIARGHLIDGSQEMVVAKYADFTTKVEMKKEYEVETGKSVDVEFTLSEEIADSLLTNRSLELSLSEGAKFDSIKGIRVTPKSGTTDNGSGDSTDATPGAKDVVVDHDTDNYGVFELGGLLPHATDASKKAEYKIEATILVPNNFEGEEILLTAEGKALSETHEIVAAKVNKVISVEVTPIDVKVGLQKQVGGKIVIKENAKEAVLRNYKDVNKASKSDATIVIAIDENFDGLRITDADIKVTEGDLLLDLDKKVVSGGRIEIPVKRQSTKPSTIEVTNIEVTANRNVPEGKYDIKVGGYALTEHSHATEFISDKAFKDDVSDENNNASPRVNVGYFFDSAVVKEFINITTKNTEDYTGVTAAKVAFVLGSNQYLVNGVAKEMDAAPFVQDGRTMVPVRYVAQALGVSEEQVAWDQATQTATIIADKVIQVKLGSKTMVVNGANVPMTAAAQLVSDRTFVPIAEIARALNVSVVWDDATKTATFN